MKTNHERVEVLSRRLVDGSRGHRPSSSRRGGADRHPHPGQRDHITGEVLSLEKGKLAYKTDNIGTLSVEWIHVKELRSANSFTFETRAGELYFGSLEESEDFTLRIVEGTAEVATVEIDSIVGIDRVKESFWSRLDGSLDAGYSFTQQNGSTQFNLNTSVHERTEHRKIQIDYSSIFSTQDDADETTRNTLNGTLYRQFTGKWFYLGAVSVQQNNGLDLDLRTLFAGGVGRRFYQSNTARLAVYTGLDYNRELYTFNEEFVNSLEAIGGVDFSYFTYDGLTSQLTAGFLILPNLTDLGRVRLQLDVNYRQNVIGNLYWNLNFFETFDSDPPQPNAPRNDFGITTSVGWSF